MSKLPLFFFFFSFFSPLLFFFFLFFPPLLLSIRRTPSPSPRGARRQLRRLLLLSSRRRPAPPPPHAGGPHLLRPVSRRHPAPPPPRTSLRRSSSPPPRCAVPLRRPSAAWPRAPAPGGRVGKSEEEPRGGTFPWLHLPSESRKRLHKQLRGWSWCALTHWAGLRPKPVLEPMLEPCALILHTHVIGRLLFVSSFISFARIACMQKLAVSVVPRGSVDSVILVQTGFN